MDKKLLVGAVAAVLLAVASFFGFGDVIKAQVCDKPVPVVISE